MIGRTNALVRALVSSVNGMSGVVVLNANIAYDPTETYEANTIGKELQDMAQDIITDEQIDAMYGQIIPPGPELGNESMSLMSFAMPQTLDDSSEEPEDAGEEEETAEEPTEETDEESAETIPEETTEENNEEEESP